MRSPSLAALAAVSAVSLLLAGCTDAPSPDPTTSAASTDVAEPAVASPTPPSGPVLAAPPTGDMRLWASTIGLPVSAAVRTTTPLARLADTPVAERAAVCRQVAADLDTIAPPQVLSGVAITADSETATLLVGDLSAKADLLSACLAGGPALDALIDEVAHTHAVAVAWLQLLRGDA